MARVKLSGVAIVIAVLAVAAGGYYFLGDSGRDKAQAAAGANRAAIPVTVASAEEKNVPIFVRGLGTVQAYKTVSVRARVDGQIVKISFEEGQEVKAGDPLFQIDPRPFQAMLEQAQAAKKRDEAQLAGAELDLDRYGKLLPSGFQSKQSWDQQKATVDALKGSIAADQAAIDTARLNLEYSDIRSPIDGRTGQRLVDLGNLVQVSQGTRLVSITQIKPIFVNFTVPQEATDAIRRNQASEPLTVYAYDTDDKTLLAEGKVTLIDNQIDTATGTLRLKAEFANADERLWPGQFVNARLRLSMRNGVVTVPQRAVMQGAQGYYAFIVKPDNTAERRVIQVVAQQDGIAVISQGLALGEKIVVDGQYRLTNGSKVRIDQPTAATPASDVVGKNG